MQASAEKIWAVGAATLRTMLNADIYNLWFAAAQGRGAWRATRIVLEVANDFCEVWLKDNYLGLIQDVLAQAAGHRS